MPSFFYTLYLLCNLTQLEKYDIIVMNKIGEIV